MKTLSEYDEQSLHGASDEELNTLLALHILGWKWVQPTKNLIAKAPDFRTGRFLQPPEYFRPDDHEPAQDDTPEAEWNWSSMNDCGLCTTGNGMLEVIEAMKKQGWEVDMGYPRFERYWCMFERTKDPEHFGSGYNINTSLPRAVAVAALLAVKGRPAS